MSLGGLSERCGQLLLALLVVTPVTHMALKLPPLAIVLAAIAIAACARGGLLRLHPHVFAWFAYYVAVGTFFVLRGLATDAPGAAFVAATYVAAPMAYAVLLLGIDRLRIVRRALSAVVAAATFTGAYLMFWAASLVGFIPEALFFKIDEKQRFGIGQGWIQVQFFGISALAFVVPFLISGLVSYRVRRWAPVPRTLMWLGLCLTLCGAVLSGRKALILVIATTPLVLGVLLQFLPRSDRGSARFRYGRMMIALGGLGSVTLVALTATGRFFWRSFLQYFLRGFTVLGGKGDDERSKQFIALLSEWVAHPLFGHGWGHGARSLVRSDRPWEYELQYVLILFSTGLIGACLYVAGVAWTYLVGVRVIRQGGEMAAHMIGLLAGLSGILIANATNPYLVSPGNMWMVFLPVALINVWLLGEPDALPAGARARPLPSLRGGSQPNAAGSPDPATAPTPA
jgi:hypothetical protein